MAIEEIGKQGAWEDRPRREPRADLTSVQLDSRQAFLLTRLDGSTTISEICAISGMTERETLDALSFLVAKGLVALEQAAGRRTPIVSAETPAIIEDFPEVPSVVPSDPVPVMEKIDSLPDFHGVAAPDARWLKSKGEFGWVPGLPWQKPGEERYGQFQFDRRMLLRHCDLTVAQRREVIFLHEVGDKLDHFEYFASEPTDDRSAWRRIYFRFTKQFHADAFFRKDLGDFKPMMEGIYARGTRIHNAFAADSDLRERYCRAVLARNDAYRAQLEAARDRFEAEKKEIEFKRDARRQSEEQRFAARRMTSLRERLQSNLEARRDRVNPALERIQRAATFFDEGMQRYRDQKFLEAAASLKLAMTYDPLNESYSEAFLRVSERANAIRAEQLWKLGYMQESVGRMDEALVSYLEAVGILPRPDYCLRTAELMLTLDKEIHRAAELARIASDADPQNVEYLLLLGKIYERVNLSVKAAAVLERALKLAPKDDRVKKALKGLKK